jgi:hypothetical protein
MLQEGQLGKGFVSRDELNGMGMGNHTPAIARDL